MDGALDAAVLAVGYAFHKLPHEVRAMTEADFNAAVAWLMILEERRNEPH